MSIGACVGVFGVSIGSGFVDLDMAILVAWASALARGCDVNIISAGGHVVAHVNCSGEIVAA